VIVVFGAFRAQPAPSPSPVNTAVFANSTLSGCACSDPASTCIFQNGCCATTACTDDAVNRVQLNIDDSRGGDDGRCCNASLPPPAPTVGLIVVTMSEKCRVVRVLQGRGGFAALQILVQELEGVPIERQRLFCDGRVIDDDTTFCEGATVRVSLRDPMRGGAPPADVDDQDEAADESRPEQWDKKRRCSFSVWAPPGVHHPNATWAYNRDIVKWQIRETNEKGFFVMKNDPGVQRKRYKIPASCGTVKRREMSCNDDVADGGHTKLELCVKCKKRYAAIPLSSKLVLCSLVYCLSYVL
jgi:hypothetical protein